MSDDVRCPMPHQTARKSDSNSCSNCSIFTIYAICTFPLNSDLHLISIPFLFHFYSITIPFLFHFYACTYMYSMKGQVLNGLVHVADWWVVGEWWVVGVRWVVGDGDWG